MSVKNVFLFFRWAIASILSEWFLHKAVALFMVSSPHLHQIHKALLTMQSRTMASLWMPISWFICMHNKTVSCNEMYTVTQFGWIRNGHCHMGKIITQTLMLPVWSLFACPPPANWYPHNRQVYSLYSWTVTLACHQKSYKTGRNGEVHSNWKSGKMDYNELANDPSTWNGGHS